MLYGTHGMLGALIGGGATYIASDDPDDAMGNSALGAVVGSTIMTLPKPAMAWAGMNMRNFSAGYYDQDPLKDMTRVEEALGNKATSIKRNFTSSVKGRAQQLGFNQGVLQAIQNSSMDDANKVYKNLKNPTQLEDLQYELKKNGQNRTAMDYYREYKRNMKGGMNVTPEEALWSLKRDTARRNNLGIDGRISNIDAELGQLDKARSQGAITQEQHYNRTAQLTLDKQNAKRKYERYGEYDRKWRHEIAKSESHAMWANRRWSNERLKMAGYEYTGQYRWGDVKDYMRSVGGQQWENDVNKYSNKLTNRLGLKKGMMLNNNTAINLIRNVHQHDMRIKRGPSRVFQKMGRYASQIAYENPHFGMKEIQLALKNLNLGGAFTYKWRDLREYGENWSNDADKPPKGLRKYNKYMNEYKGMSRNARRSERGQFLFKEMSNQYSQNEARKIASQMKKQGAFRAGTRGQFQLSGIGRVTNSYLEGGINATVDYKPFIEPGSRATKIAQRMVTSDLSDLPMSGHSGFQRNIPFIVEEEFRTYDGRSGKEMTRNMTRANPFYGQDNRLNELKEKKLTRGDVKHYIRKKGMSTESLRYIKRKAIENPKSFLKFAGKRIPGLALHPVTMGAGLLAWHLIGQKEGEKELDEII